VWTQHKSSLLSSLPPPEHVTNLTSLIPQSLSKAAATMKSKTSLPRSAHSQKPAVEPTRTAKPASSVGFVENRRSAAVSSSAIEDSDDDESGTADFFSLDAADKPALAMYPSSVSRVVDTADVRWIGSSTKSAAFMPSTDAAGISNSTPDIVWNAMSYSVPATELPSVTGDTVMVCTLYSSHCCQVLVQNRCFAAFGFVLCQVRLFAQID